MRIPSFSLIAGLTCVASIASAELAEGERGEIHCAATALVLRGVVTSMDELDVPVPEGALSFAVRASDALYTGVVPLLDQGSEGAGEFTRVIDVLVAERDAALSDGSFTQWFPTMVDRVTDCYVAFAEQQEVVE